MLHAAPFAAGRQESRNPRRDALDDAHRSAEGAVYRRTVATRSMSR